MSYPVVQLHGSDDIKLNIPSSMKNILHLKKTISIQSGSPFKQIYLIDNKCDNNPKDDDMIDRNNWTKYLFHIVQSIDDVDILKNLGRGAFGSIFLCQHKISQELFVLKKPIGRKNLDREIIIHSIINRYSSSICRHRGLFSDQGTICSAMDYKSGGTLDEFIKKERYLREHEISIISHQILIQIKEIHKRGVIHRDIKPDNIVLDEYKNVYLIDFGISKRANNMIFGESFEIINKSSPGAAHYMAPELTSNDSVTEKIDTWSFGVMVIEMVNGRRPNFDLPNFTVISKIIRECKIDFQLPESATAELRDFINSCVEPNPINRATIDELIQSNFIRKYRRHKLTNLN